MTNPYLYPHIHPKNETLLLKQQSGYGWDVHIFYLQSFRKITESHFIQINLQLLLMSCRNLSHNASKNDFMPKMPYNSAKDHTPIHLLFYIQDYIKPTHLYRYTTASSASRVFATQRSFVCFYFEIFQLLVFSNYTFHI